MDGGAGGGGGGGGGGGESKTVKSLVTLLIDNPFFQIRGNNKTAVRSILTCM